MTSNSEELFLRMAYQVSNSLSSCLSRKVGAILRNSNALSTGYNGCPENEISCTESGYCIRKIKDVPSGERLDLCRAVHAEHRAIENFINMGENPEGATMFITTQPCDECAKRIIEAGIGKVVYKESYPNSNSIALLKQAGIEVIKL